MKFLGISGTPKLDSLNSMLLYNAFELLNREHQWEVVSVANIPIFEQTEEADSVQKLRKKLKNRTLLLYPHRNTTTVILLL
jgi:NADPH-dependent FMN reductase.